MTVGNVGSPLSIHEAYARRAAYWASWWHCRCVKLDDDGVVTHFKKHPPCKKRCIVCGWVNLGAAVTKGGAA